jgi:hypothetical protein
MSSPVSGLRSPVSPVSSKRVEELRRKADEIIAITVSSIKTARKGAQK